MRVSVGVLISVDDGIDEGNDEAINEGLLKGRFMYERLELCLCVIRKDRVDQHKKKVYLMSLFRGKVTSSP